MNPFLTIGVLPRETIRFVLANHPRAHVISLAMLWGVANHLDEVSNRGWGDFSPWSSLVIEFAFGAVLGVVLLYLLAFSCLIVGRQLGGRADFRALRAAFAWSFFPIVLMMLVWVVVAVFFGPGMLFDLEWVRFRGLILTTTPVYAFFHSLAAICSVVVLCMAVAEVQGFKSFWRGFWNVALAGLVVLLGYVLVYIGVLLVQ